MSEGAGYVRIGELARRTGTSPELLRAWEHRYGLLRPSRSNGGFRLYSDDDEARVLRAKALIAEGLSASEAAGLALASGVGEEEERPLADSLAAEMKQALDRFDEDGAHRALDRLLGSFSVNAVMRDVLLPYLHALGDRWASGEASVGQEHFASNLLRGRLLGLARGWGAGRGPSLVLACPPGEEHDLGLIMFGIVASRRGWRVTYLGQDTPFATLEDIAQTVHPSLVAFAVAEGTSLAPHARALRALATHVRVAVGGGVSAEEVASLGLRVLEGDPVAAGEAIRPNVTS